MLKGILPKHAFADSVSWLTIVIVFIPYTEFSEEPTNENHSVNLHIIRSGQACLKDCLFTLKLREINKTLLRKNYIHFISFNYQKQIPSPSKDSTHIFCSLFRFLLFPLVVLTKYTDTLIVNISNL